MNMFDWGIFRPVWKGWRMSSAMTITMSSAITITMSSAYSPTLLSLYLRHSSFSNPSVASPTSQFFLQPFFRFSYVTSSSLTLPGEPSHELIFIVHWIMLSLTHKHFIYSAYQQVTYANLPSYELGVIDGKNFPVRHIAFSTVYTNII